MFKIAYYFYTTHLCSRKKFSQYTTLIVQNNNYILFINMYLKSVNFKIKTK